MKTKPRDHINSCMSTLLNRLEFLIQQIEGSDRELHYFKAEKKALEYALELMRHEMNLVNIMEQRIRDRKIAIAN